METKMSMTVRDYRGDRQARRKRNSIQTTLILEDAKIISSRFHFVKEEN